MLVSLLTLLGSTAQAQTLTWDGGGSDNNWSTPGNWSNNDVPDGSGKAALFTDDEVGQTKPAPNLSADVTIGQLQFSAAAPSYSITGSGPATLFLSPNASFDGVGVLVASGAADQTILAAEVEFLSSQKWNIEGTTTLLVTGTIEDAPSPDYALTKNGTGTLVFSGDVRYDGATTINAGALVLSHDNSSMLSAYTVNAGLLRATTHGNALGNNPSDPARNNITLAGGALELAKDEGLTFGHANRNTIVSGNTTIRSDRLIAGAGVTHALGRLQIGAQTLSVAAGAFVSSGTAGLTFGTTTLTTNGAAFDVASGANLTLGALSGNFAFTKQGSGQITLNTAAIANRTSARVTLSSGAMKLGNASALGTAAVPLTLNGGTLDLAINSSVNAHNTTVGGNATIASGRSTGGSGVTHTLGTLAIGTQTLSLTAGANAASGTAGITFGATTLSGDATFDVVNSDSADVQLTLGAIGESGGVRSLTKTGNGTLALTATNSYTGNTTVQAGKLALANRGLADSADVFLSTGSTLELTITMNCMWFITI
ncbi:MAG: autotransporter-associated beta strand repeat-containing protein [Pirellulales bacterium]